MKRGEAWRTNPNPSVSRLRRPRGEHAGHRGCPGHRVVEGSRSRSHMVNIHSSGMFAITVVRNFGRGRGTACTKTRVCNRHVPATRFAPWVLCDTVAEGRRGRASRATGCATVEHLLGRRLAGRIDLPANAG